MCEGGRWRWGGARWERGRRRGQGRSGPLLVRAGELQVERSGRHQGLSWCLSLLVRRRGGGGRRFEGGPECVVELLVAAAVRGWSCDRRSVTSSSLGPPSPPFEPFTDPSQPKLPLVPFAHCRIPIPIPIPIATIGDQASKYMFRSVSVAAGVVDALPGRLSKHTPHLHECRRSWAGVDSPPVLTEGHQDNPPRRCSMRSIIRGLLSLARPRTLSQPRVSAGRLLSFCTSMSWGGPRGVKFSGLESVPPPPRHGSGQHWKLRKCRPSAPFCRRHWLPEALLPTSSPSVISLDSVRSRKR